MSMLSRSYLLRSKVLVCTCALLALFLSMPAGKTNIVSAQSGERTLSVHMPAAKHVRATRLKSPPVIPDEEKTRLQAVQSQLHRRGPATRVNTSASTRAAPASPPASIPRAAATLAKPRTASSSAAPGDFTLFQNTDLHTLVSNTTNLVAEPSVGNIGSAVFETGNWFAAVSRDRGNTFDFIDPYAIFPPSYSGFCCDQRVLYDPSRDLVFWALMYRGNSNGNIIRLAIAHGEAALETDPIPFYKYDFAPQDLNPPSPEPIIFPTGYWYDYPQIALGSNYLYITANVYQPPFPFGSIPPGPFYRTVVLRVPLDGLASGLGFDYSPFITNYFNATPVQEASNIMYWATQVDTATMRVYQWPESSNQPSAVNIGHTSYPDPSNPANYTCPLTGGVQDWCGRLDDRVQTGWLSGGILGFVWSAPKGTGGFGTFNYPYLQFLFVNSYTLTKVGESTMSNSAYAYAYPSAGVNAWGHVAGTVFYGGGATPPTLAAFLWDNYSSPPYPLIPSAWDLHTIAASSQGPVACNCWGDYLTATLDRTSVFSRFLWSATGYTLQGGGIDSNVTPYYLRFGRQANDPASVELNNKPLYLPLTSKSQ